MGSKLVSLDGALGGAGIVGRFRSPGLASVGRRLLVSLLAVSVPAVPAPAQGEARRYDIGANLARLAARPPRGEWSFAVLGDSRGGLAVLGAILARVERERPAFSIYTGDLVGESTQGEWQAVRSTLARTVRDVPVFPVVGNHETYAEGVRLFHEVFGNPGGREDGPVDYRFDHGGARFVMMDNSRSGKYGPEGFSDEQMDWLDRQLADAPGPAFVAAHKPPNTAKWEHAFYRNSRTFMALLEKHRVAAGLFGHIHAYDRHERGGVTYLVLGGAGAPLYPEKGPYGVIPSFFDSPRGVKAHNFAIVTVSGRGARFQVYTDQAKLARLNPRRSAAIDLGHEDFEPWDAGVLAPARAPAGAR